MQLTQFTDLGLRVVMRLAVLDADASPPALGMLRSSSTCRIPMPPRWLHGSVSSAS